MQSVVETAGRRNMSEPEFSGVDGMSSWVHAFSARQTGFGESEAIRPLFSYPAPRARCIFHQVRNPLLSIASRSANSNPKSYCSLAKYWSRFSKIEWKQEPGWEEVCRSRVDRLRLALRHWVTWNSFVANSGGADATYRLEDFSADRPFHSAI